MASTTKDARYLVRLANEARHRPSDQSSLLTKVRALAQGAEGKVINLRVTPAAIEFDLFCAPDVALEPFFDAWRRVGQKLTSKRLDVPPGVIVPQAVVAEARHLFNEYRFWEVHEVLEGLWKELKGAEKNLVQGLILTAAALVHAQKDEEGVMWTMLADALKRLEGQPDDYYGWDIGKFQKHFARVLKAKKLDFPTV
jgi:hypothetical protein